MLNKEEWKEFERLCDDEFMTQVEDAGFEACLDGVKLALSIVEKEPTHEAALNYLNKYAQIDTISVPNQVRRALYVKNYGEEEVIAMEAVNEVPYRSEK